LAILEVVVARLANCTDDGVTAAKVVLLDLTESYIDIGRASEVTRGANERVVVEHFEDSRDGDEHIIFAHAVEVVVTASAALPVSLAPAVALGG
jgi:hypothetical protein